MVTAYVPIYPEMLVEDLVNEWLELSHHFSQQELVDLKKPPGTIQKILDALFK